MTDMLSFMAAPFAACLVLVGLHAYFGIHVIERRILFVDLAVAQFAALGAVVGFAFGQHPGGLQLCLGQYQQELLPTSACHNVAGTR